MNPTFRVVRTSYQTWQVIAHTAKLRGGLVVFETGNKAKAEAVEAFLDDSTYSVRLKWLMQDLDAEQMQARLAGQKEEVA